MELKDVLKALSVSLIDTFEVRVENLTILDFLARSGGAKAWFLPL